MISTKLTSDVWKAYLFAADVIAARIFRKPPQEESEGGLHEAREHGEPWDNLVRPGDDDYES